MAPRKVTVKVLTVNKPAKQIFDFFSDVKNMEIGKSKVFRSSVVPVLNHKFIGNRSVGISLEQLNK